MSRRLRRTPRHSAPGLGLWLEAVCELPMPSDDQLAHALRVRPILGLDSLIQELQLGLLVLKHVLLSRDLCLQLENRLLIRGLRDRVDQLLNRSKATARVGQRLVRQALKKSYGLTPGLHLRARRG